jgi:hypothetical protein
MQTKSRQMCQARRADCCVRLENRFEMKSSAVFKIGFRRQSALDQHIPPLGVPKVLEPRPDAWVRKFEWAALYPPIGFVLGSHSPLRM